MKSSHSNRMQIKCKAIANLSFLGKQNCCLSFASRQWKSALYMMTMRVKGVKAKKKFFALFLHQIISEIHIVNRMKWVAKIICSDFLDISSKILVILVHSLFDDLFAKHKHNNFKIPSVLTHQRTLSLHLWVALQ